MKCLLLTVALFVAGAQAWITNCGTSKYSDAGRPVLERIVGGAAARQGEFPYQLSLRRFNSHMCGAVLVNSMWALTAAHCTSGQSASSLDVAAGEHLRNSPPSTRTLHGVSYFVNHPSYSSSTLANDIAVIRFSNAVSYHNDRRPGCEPTTSTYASSTSIVSGWGSTYSGQFSGGPATNELRYTDLPIMSDAECRSAISPIYSGMMCAGFAGTNIKDSCQGDSGGPLAVKVSSRFYMVGLVSWGYGCASSTPGVYTRVSYFKSWVDGYVYT